MTKKKEKKSEFQDVVGTPTLMLLPARNYKFKVYDQDYSVTVPRKGKYVDLDDKMFTEEDGDFNIMQYSRKDKAQVVYLPDLSRVMFATSQYPDLKDTQAFTPIALVIKKDTVDIVGNVIEMTKEK
jgi:hypothetical protein